MVMFSKQGTAGQAWHQDCSPDQAQIHNLNRLAYTSDISEECGGQTVIVRGSHRKGLLPAGDPVGHFNDEVVLTPRKGTLILLHGHCWHRVLPILKGGRVSTNLPRGSRGHAGRYHRCLRLSQHAVSVLDVEGDRGSHALDVILEFQARAPRHDGRFGLRLENVCAGPPPPHS